MASLPPVIKLFIFSHVIPASLESSKRVPGIFRSSQNHLSKPEKRNQVSESVFEGPGSCQEEACATCLAIPRSIRGQAGNAIFILNTIVMVLTLAVCS